MPTTRLRLAAAAFAVTAALTCASNAEAGPQRANTPREAPASAASSLAPCGTLTAGANDPPSAVVRVDNLVAIRPEDLRFAQDRAGAVFNSIGARIVWIDTDTAVRQRMRAAFTLVLVASDTSSEQTWLVAEALGVAAPPVRRAHVFYDRIATLNTRASGGILTILGDVMAHELGHLLLPLPGHSAWGIMRPNVTTNIAPPATFSKSQAGEILCRLRLLR